MVGYMKVDINEVIAMFKRRREINSVPLENIIWMDGDKVLEVPREWIDRYKFTGLNNVDFIDMEIYKHGMEET